MHELTITKAILKTVDRALSEHGARRLISLKLRIGELTCVDPEALEFCFDACTKGTRMQGAKLLIERVAPAYRCHGCNAIIETGAFWAVCPTCSIEAKREHGNELDIVSMEAD